MFSVKTDYPIAWKSRDTTHPGGTANDSSRNHRFNEKLYLMDSRKPLRLADFGCAGGGFVSDCLQDGHLAIGLEGSDYSLIRGRAEWSTIPENLFTTDITKPFTIMEGEEPAKLDYITAWEVMEHILEQDLPGLCDNVRRHLTPNGLWIMSVSEQFGEHHVCVHNRDWWLGILSREGFTNQPDLVTYFGDDWVRGPKQNAPQSFHLIVKQKQV